MIDFKQKLEEEESKIKKENNFREEEILIKPKNKWITTYTIVVIVLALIFAGKILASSLNSNESFIGNFFNSVKHLIPLNNKTLAGEKNDRINILLLGMGNSNHAGAYLTDTIILASFKPSTKQIALISIPRDLVSPVSNWEKINSINAYAEKEYPGKGGEITAQKISTLLRIPIQYYVRLDFNGFVNIINELGGIRINVPHTLDDYTYPIFGQEDNPDYYSRFQHLHVNKGWQNMNGSLALKYARSRHALGPEGSDFARAHRQQLILEAIKNKLLSTKTILNPLIISKVINEFNKNISTNLKPWEIIRLWNIFKDTRQAQIINKVISDDPHSFLIAGRNQKGAYILTPRSGNFKDIQNFVQNIFSKNEIDYSKKYNSIITDQANVIILNGTWINGLASKNAILLKQAKFNILKISNAPVRNSLKTIVYDLSYGKKEKDLKILEKITGASESFSGPSWLKNYTEDNSSSTEITPLGSSTPKQINKADFILVVGTDSNKAE